MKSNKSRINNGDNKEKRKKYDNDITDEEVHSYRQVNLLNRASWQVVNLRFWTFLELFITIGCYNFIAVARTCEVQFNNENLINTSTSI